MALEMGKPVAQGRAEADKCAWACEHYAEHAERLPRAGGGADRRRRRATWPSSRSAPSSPSCPGTSPSGRSSASPRPALMAGNVGLLKHASNVSGCALAIEEILHAAGVPRDAFRALLVGSPRVAALVEAPEVVAVTLTGSTPAGRAVAAAAGACLKKSVLELGGSDPYVDPRGRRPRARGGDLRRLAPPERRAELHRGQAVRRGRERPPGLPGAARRARCAPGGWATRSRRATDVGPQARRDLRDELHRQVEASVARGARVLLGCRVPDGPGAFYPPSVLAGVRPGHARLRRGALRPRGRDRGREGRAGRHPPRQPHRLRPRRRRLHARPRARREDRPPRARRPAPASSTLS